VLAHLAALAGKALYLVIATRPANAVLPDGRNAHLLVRSADWWLERLDVLGFPLREVGGNPAREISVTLRK
jgi:hypothetical protein